MEWYIKMIVTLDNFFCNHEKLEYLGVAESTYCKTDDLVHRCFICGKIITDSQRSPINE